MQRGLAFIMVGVLALCGRPAWATEGAPIGHVQIPEGPELRWVLLAANGAAERLSVARCAAVLSDFRDAEGRTLRERLEASGVTLDDHLRRLWFVRGEGQRPCSSTRTSAFTVPGGHMVFVCPSVFRHPVTMHDQLLLIHEFLHTLGLGENPPTSAEITKQVTRRCS